MKVTILMEHRARRVKRTLDVEGDMPELQLLRSEIGKAHDAWVEVLGGPPTLRVWENGVHWVIAESAEDALDVLREVTGASLSTEEEIEDEGGEFCPCISSELTMQRCGPNEDETRTHPLSVWCEIEGRGYLGGTEY